MSSFCGHCIVSGRNLYLVNSIEELSYSPLSVPPIEDGKYQPISGLFWYILNFAKCLPSQGYNLYIESKSLANWTSQQNFPFCDRHWLQTINAILAVRRLRQNAFLTTSSNAFIQERKAIIDQALSACPCFPKASIKLARKLFQEFPDSISQQSQLIHARFLLQQGKYLKALPYLDQSERSCKLLYDLWQKDRSNTYLFLYLNCYKRYQPQFFKEYNISLLMPKTSVNDPIHYFLALLEEWQCEREAGDFAKSLESLGKLAYVKHLSDPTLQAILPLFSLLHKIYTDENRSVVKDYFGSASELLQKLHFAFQKPFSIPSLFSLKNSKDLLHDLSAEIEFIKRRNFIPCTLPIKPYLEGAEEHLRNKRKATISRPFSNTTWRHDSSHTVLNVSPTPGAQAKACFSNEHFTVTVSFENLSKLNDELSLSIEQLINFCFESIQEENYFRAVLSFRDGTKAQYGSSDESTILLFIDHLKTAYASSCTPEVLYFFNFITSINCWLHISRVKAISCAGTIPDGHFLKTLLQALFHRHICDTEQMSRTYPHAELNFPLTCSINNTIAFETNNLKVFDYVPDYENAFDLIFPPIYSNVPCFYHEKALYALMKNHPVKYTGADKAQKAWELVDTQYGHFLLTKLQNEHSDLWEVCEVFNAEKERHHKTYTYAYGRFLPIISKLNNLAPAFRAFAFTSWAHCLYKFNQKESAIEYLNQALSIDPKNEAPRVIKAKILAKSGGNH